MKRKLLIVALQLVLGITLIQAQIQHDPGFPIHLRADSIQDFLINKLIENRILIIPECLSHDSFDAIRLPIEIIKRWQKIHGSKKLVIGLEHDNLKSEFELIKNNEYHNTERFATICPGAWGLFSTKRLNEYLLFADIERANPDNFEIFGFENSYHYYSERSKKYVLPSQVDTLNGAYEKIPYLDSEAPMIIKYAYSRFFRDYLSFKSIEEAIKNDPSAYFIIIVGNAHTLKKWTFNDTDYQIIDAYSLDTSKYAHTLGYYLKEKYGAVFVQSEINAHTTYPSLLTHHDALINKENYSGFFYDYFYMIPDSEDANIEEPPLLSIPSISNLNLLKQKNFQYYHNEEFELVAQHLIYLFTGITPMIEEDTLGQSGSCTFINPKTEMPIDLDVYRDSLMVWYKDGTFLKRIAENPAQYNHRSLFKGIFRLMKKEQDETFTLSEQKEFLSYLYAALSVIGDKTERDFARKELQSNYGFSEDHYFYFKHLYGVRFNADNLKIQNSP